MEALDGMDLAARLSMESKEYWVHLDTDGLLEKYPAKQHARRVQEKLGINEGLIYLAGQPAKNNEDSDMPAPFRQRRYFYYLTGCNEPSCHMTYDIQHDTLSLFIPRIDPKRVIWNGRGSNLAEAVERYDIDEVYYIDELGDAIKDWSKYYGGQGSDIYVLHNGQLPRIPGLHAIIDSESLRPAMNAVRMIKDDHEISLIRKANNISSDAHREILANILKFKNEAEVEGLFLDVCIAHQAKLQAYDPIAASGPNAGTLHYDANNENFGDRQLMCLDAGCEYELYASDITRTFPLAESWPTKEAENIYKLVERMQESCIARLAPGVRYLDLHILAHQIAIDGLLKLGILHNGTREEIYNAGTSRAFFPHGLGHHIGLEVHDVGQAELMSVREGKVVADQALSLFPQNFHQPVYDPATCYAPTDAQSSQLEQGMVVTVEPGLYFSVYALQHFYLPSPVHSRFINLEVLQRYLPVGGVRIEDDILITSKGYENLTTAPKGDAMFSIIRGDISKMSAVNRPTVVPSTGAREPTLFFRAPGVPATAQVIAPIHRSSTMPCQPALRNVSGLDSRNHSLGFRRSMTTDERVQYWRQSCQRSSPPQPPSLHRGITMTLCGASSPGSKHMFVGDGGDVPHQPQGLPLCTKCAILAQTLGRLRQTLASSESDNTYQHTMLGPVRSVPTRHVQPSKSRARHDVSKAAGEARTGSATTRLPDRTVCEPSTNSNFSMSERKQIITPLLSQSSLPLDMNEYFTSAEENFVKPRMQGPEQYYRDFSPSQHVAYVAEPLSVDATDRQHVARPHNPDQVAFPCPRSQEHVSVEIRRPQRQDTRRPSNHTDDRDWMA